MKRTLVSLAALAAAAGLALPAQASTIEIIGSLGNFDVYNNDPDSTPNSSPNENEQEHGFEIEFESGSSSDLNPSYPTWGNYHYGYGVVSDPNGAASGYRVRYASKYTDTNGQIWQDGKSVG